MLAMSRMELEAPGGARERKTFEHQARKDPSHLVKDGGRDGEDEIMTVMIEMDESLPMMNHY